MNNFLKWLGTAILILGTAVNSLNIYPGGVILLIIGGWLWLAVAVRIKDRPLIVTNLVMSMTALIGLLWRYFG
jgi:uncharacterized protein with PQ loop repeat